MTALLTEFTVEGKVWATMNGSHKNPHVHNALQQRWKRAAAIAIRDAMCQPVREPVRITVVTRRTRNVHADASNLAPTGKACIDAAVEAGILSEDCDCVVRSTTYARGPKASVPTVEITIEHEGESA